MTIEVWKLIRGYSQLIAGQVSKRNNNMTCDNILCSRNDVLKERRIERQIQKTKKNSGIRHNRK